MSFCRELPDGAHLWGRCREKKSPWKLYKKLNGGLMELDTYGVNGLVSFDTIDQWETVFPPPESPEEESFIVIRSEIFILRPEGDRILMRHYIRGEAGFLWPDSESLYFRSTETALRAILTQDYSQGRNE